MRLDLVRFCAPLLALSIVTGCGGQSTVKPSAQTKADKTAPAATTATRPDKLDTVVITPSTKVTANPASMAAARRFLNSWGAGEVIQVGFERAVVKIQTDQPGVAEVTRRVFADFKTSDFVEIAAQVYTRHLNVEQLESLAQFSETPTGKHFFKVAIAQALSGQKTDPKNMLRDFNADELTAIMKFGQSDVFVALQRELPTINREMGEEGEKLGQQKVREYLKKH